jgi:C1A family cysteine protease
VVIYVKIDGINRAIAKKKAQWVAKDHPFLQLSEKELWRHIGVVVNEKNLEKLRKQTKPDLAKILAGAVRYREKPMTYEAAQKVLSLRHEMEARLHADSLFDYYIVCLEWGRDWRNVGGRNCVTPVKDQGMCSSGTSFAALATLESMVLIERNVETDLSEAELQFCSGGDCTTSTWPIDAVNYIKSHGIGHESCFPYQDHNTSCTTCSLRDGEAITVSTDVTIFDVQQRKDYLWAIGPMIAVFEVFPDFFAYSSGVYTPTNPLHSSLGCHAVEVIGYSPCQKAWICKNAWGARWGDNGFFKIAYGQCGIDTTYPFIGISGTKWWQP